MAYGRHQSTKKGAGVGDRGDNSVDTPESNSILVYSDEDSSGNTAIGGALAKAIGKSQRRQKKRDGRRSR